MSKINKANELVNQLRAMGHDIDDDYMVDLNFFDDEWIVVNIQDVMRNISFCHNHCSLISWIRDQLSLNLCNELIVYVCWIGLSLITLTLCINIDCAN